MITCPRCEGEGELNYTCKACNGTGEGLHEGTSCPLCLKGEGVIRDNCDMCKGKRKVLAPKITIFLKNDEGNHISSKYLEFEEIEENKLCLSIIDKQHEIFDQINFSIDEFLELAENVKKMREE